MVYVKVFYWNVCENLKPSSKKLCLYTFNYYFDRFMYVLC